MDSWLHSIHSKASNEITTPAPLHKFSTYHKIPKHLDHLFKEKIIEEIPVKFVLKIKKNKHKHALWIHSPPTSYVAARRSIDKFNNRYRPSKIKTYLY